MKNLAIITLLAIGLGSFTGCKSDKEDPTISLTTPAEHSHFDRGTSFHVHLEFGDDFELASYELEIANQDGSHNHDFHWEDSGTISGESASYMGDIDVPATAPDMMWLHVTVMDEVGNEVSDSFMLHFDN